MGQNFSQNASSGEILMINSTTFNIPLPKILQGRLLTKADWENESGTCRRATLCSLLLFMKLGLHSTSRPNSLPFCLDIHSCTTRPSFVIVTANCFAPAVVTCDRIVFSPDPSCSPTMSELVQRYNNYASRASIPVLDWYHLIFIPFGYLQ